MTKDDLENALLSRGFRQGEGDAEAWTREAPGCVREQVTWLGRSFALSAFNYQRRMVSVSFHVDLDEPGFSLTWDSKVEALLGDLRKTLAEAVRRLQAVGVQKEDES
jgi:hypothetical protein